jgi:hypothetical protein
MTNTHTWKGNGLIWTLVLLALLGLIALFTACGGQRPGDVPPAPRAMALHTSPPDSMHLADSTFQACLAAFQKHFSLAGGAPIAGTQQEVPWADLAAWVQRGADNHAVRFEYGLRDSTFVLGLVRLKLDTTATPGLFTYQLPDTVHELDNGTLVPHHGDTWRTQRQYAEGDTNTYFGRVRRDQEGAGPQPILHGVDAQANVMPWELELLPLYTANQGEHRDSTLHAVFTCISAPDSAKVMQHRMAVHLRLRPTNGTGYRDLLDNNHDPRDVFRRHAADYGNLCPSFCNSYRLVPQ